MTAKIAYVAQPIDQAYDITAWAGDVGRICDELRGAGYHTYQPARAWATPKPPGPAELDPRLEEVNGWALRRADVLVAYLPPRVPTIGVPMEINQALHYRIPVVVVTEAESYSLQREGVIVVNSWLLAVDAVRAHEHNHPWFLTRRPGVSRDLDLIKDRLWTEPEPIRLVIQEGAKVPARAYPDDAGLDLTTAREYTIAPGAFVDIHTQVDAVQLPAGHWGLITGRSSTLRKHGLHVPVAVIDPGWRGPLFVGVWNLSKKSVGVYPGDRLGQLIILPNNPAPVLSVSAVEDADRGLAGFGSSGT